MNTPKHTPAPWVWTDRFKNPQGENTWTLFVPHRCYGVLSCDVLNSPVALNKYDAALIAASPDLLSSLKELTSMCERQKDFNDDGDGEALARAKSTIAMATSLPELA